MFVYHSKTTLTHATMSNNLHKHYSVTWKAFRTEFSAQWRDTRMIFFSRFRTRWNMSDLPVACVQTKTAICQTANGTRLPNYSSPATVLIQKMVLDRTRCLSDSELRFGRYVNSTENISSVRSQTGSVFGKITHPWEWKRMPAPPPLPPSLHHPPPINQQRQINICVLHIFRQSQLFQYCFVLSRCQRWSLTCFIEFCRFPCLSIPMLEPARDRPITFPNKLWLVSFNLLHCHRSLDEQGV